VSGMAIVLLPLVLTAITLVAVGRAMAQVADEADQLRAVVARARTMRPVVDEISAGTRQLNATIARLGR
jgi:hypothetical protein